MSDEHVGRLDVAMNDADLVRGAQRFEHGDRDVHGLQHVKTAFPPQQGGERIAIEMLHDIEGHATVGGARVSHVDDVGVL